MTHLRSLPSDFENVFQLPPGVLVPLDQAAAGHARTRVAQTFFVAVRGLAVTVLRAWRRAIEARRARHRLMQLDDHLLRDIGLSRPDVCFNDFEALGGHRRAGEIR
jgi:uncharacterized protein YjiS (DUF1127 family)